MKNQIVWMGAFLFSSLALANTERTVSVSGMCTRQVTPDRGSITLTAEFTDHDLRDATKKATDLYGRVRDQVKRLNLPDLELQTSEYNVQEAREWEKNKMVSKGFRARMGLRVSSSAIDRLGEVISIASRQSVQDVGALTTYLSDEKTKHEQFACLQTAAENARAKADRLAASLKASVGDVVKITEEVYNPSPSPIRPMMALKATAADAGAPQVEAQKQEVSANVQVVFGLK